MLALEFISLARKEWVKMADGYDWNSGILMLAQPGKTDKAPAEYQPIIEKGDLDALESLFMERIDSVPENIEFFLPGYRFFLKRKEHERAAALLQLHMDCLQAKNCAQATQGEITLLSALLLFWQDCKPARDGLVRHLRALYCDSPHFDDLYIKLDIEKSTGLDALRLFETWLRYDEGRVIYMPSRGTGRVREVNLAVSKLRVVFESGEQMSFKIDEAQRLCLSLPKEHFLSVKLDDPERIVALAGSDPGELFSFLFKSVNRTLATAELRDMLRGIVPDAAWTAWWARARKDRRLMVGTGTKPDIRWNESSDAAASDIMQQFERAGGLEKCVLMRQHAGRFEELREPMLAGIVTEADAALKNNPSLALELYLELEDFAGKPPCGAGFSPADLLARDDAADIIAGVKDRLLRRSAIALVAELRPDWPAMFGRLLQNEADAQCLAFLYESLRDKGQAQLCDQVVSRAIGDPPSMPRFYAWICKEMPSRPELLSKADAAFVLSLLRVLDNKAFKGQHTALRKLFDLGEAADRAVTGLDETDAARTLESLNKDNGLEDYRKDRIRQEIFHLHPHLHEKKVELIYVTEAKIEEKRQELKKLVSVDIPQNSKEIQRTREYGDLRENFEYHAARARQEMLSSRAKTLHDDLNRTRTIESLAKDLKKVSIGTKVFLRPASGPGEELVFTVLGPWDSDPAQNILSYTSAAGAMLLGVKQGESIPFNDSTYVVDRIEAWRSLP
jgi:transcription elongation factor GreA